VGSDRLPFRSRTFRFASHFLHWSGLLALARPFVNAARLRLDRTGRPAFPFVRWRKTRNAQILIYHRVNDDGDPYFRGIPTVEFERQMAYVSSRFHVLALSDLVSRLREGALPDNSIAVTLDDGYRDNYINAFPVLQRHSVPATIFLATSAIGSARQLWHDDVFSAFRETVEPTLEPFGPARIGGPLATVADRLRVQQEVLAYIRILSETKRAEVVTRLRDALRVGPPREAPGLMLSWDEVRAMHRAGVHFGSHSATHPIMSRVDPYQARHEVVESKRKIEEELGVVVDGFAYPNGARTDFRAESKGLLREAGYAYAVTTIPGPNEPEADVFELRRATPWDEDIFAFGVRLLYNKLGA